jgi:hypothetical protein
VFLASASDSIRVDASASRVRTRIRTSCDGSPGWTDQNHPMRRERRRDLQTQPRLPFRRQLRLSRGPSAGPRTTSPEHSQPPSAPPPPPRAGIWSTPLGPGRGISGRRSLLEGRRSHQLGGSCFPREFSNSEKRLRQRMHQARPRPQARRVGERVENRSSECGSKDAVCEVCGVRR